MSLARRVLDLHGAGRVELLQADVCALSADALPREISVCLIDVDLYAPIMASLDKVWPRLQPGGFVLVDDCHPSGNDSWQAGEAFAEFVAKRGLAHRVEFGMGIFQVPMSAGT